jgi:hypothetical protein
MRIVTLGDGLEEIGEMAFSWCESLEEIIIPNNVRVITNGALMYCRRLRTVTLGSGLEEIGLEAFQCCTSLHEIAIPNAVTAIKARVFYRCSGLTTVILGDGVEEIGNEAFKECTVLQHILIPPAVKTIDDNAFQGCTNLLQVQFCPRIEECVASEAIRNWWNQGLHKQCLATYCFLVRCSILERLGFIRVQNAQANIFDMLGRVPTIRRAKLDLFFASINSRLLFYESLMHSAALLELVFWKSKIIDHFSPSNIPLLTMEMKMQCRHDSIRMVSIIVPHVMSFLTDGDDRDQRRRWRSRR